MSYEVRVCQTRPTVNKEIYKIITEGISNDMLKTIWSNLSGREPKPVNFGKQLIRHFSPNHDPAFVQTVTIALCHEH